MACTLAAYVLRQQDIQRLHFPNETITKAASLVTSSKSVEEMDLAYFLAVM